MEGTDKQLKENSDSKLTPEVALQVVHTAHQPKDFTKQYNQAVELLEDLHLERALEALREGSDEKALKPLADAQLLRDGYLDLLQRSEADPKHDLRSELVDLRKIAQARQMLATWIGQLTSAMKAFRAGEWNKALQTLDREDPALAGQPVDPDLHSEMSTFAAGIGEMLGGEIRAAVQDYAGARAAYDRSAATFRRLEDVVAEGSAQEAQLPAFPRVYSEASSLRAQLAQLLQANDYESGAKVAKAASARYIDAADHMEREDPGSGGLLVPLVRGMAAEKLAQAEECEAELALEQQNWNSALDHSKGVSDLYDTASKECLKSALPSAQASQERMLNAAFNWGVQFRRRVDREKAAAKRYDDVREELEMLRNSVRDALQPAGVTLSSNTEIANEVHQQVETVTRVESNVRNLLREIPAALRAAELSPELRETLEGEAFALIRADESGPTFLDKVKSFSSKLSDAVSSAGATASGIVGLLKALSLLA